MRTDARLQVDPTIYPELEKLVGNVDRLSGNTITSADVGLEGGDLVARSLKGKILLGEIERSGGTSAGWDPSDGKVDKGNLVHVRQLASKGSVALAMMNREVVALFEGVEQPQSLLAVLQGKLEETEDRKKGTKAQAKEEIKDLSDSKWARSFFTKDEADLAIEARYRELWTRTDSRKGRALEAQIKILEQIIEKERALPSASDPAAAKEELRSLKVDYLELSASAAANDEGNLKAVLSFVRAKLRRLHVLPRADQFTSGQALDVATGSPTEDPVDSRLVQRRADQDITPERLLQGSFWWKDRPSTSGVLTLLGFRDRTAKGTHPSVVCQNAKGEEVQIKLFTEKKRDVSTPAINSRLLYAMGRETEGSDAVPRVQVEARVVLAAFENMNRPVPGIKLPDDHIPGVGGPGKKIGFFLKHHMNENVIGAVKLVGVDKPLTGAEAVAKLETAKSHLRIGDRGPLNAIEYVELMNVDVEYDGPTSSIGGYQFDSLGHQDRRDVRTYGATASTLLGIWDAKADNVRTDIRKREDGGIDVLHLLSDVDGPSGEDLSWIVGVKPGDKRLHTDNIRHDVQAVDRQTENDFIWDLRDFAKLSEEQIKASVAAGTFDRYAGWEHFEKLLARRDELVGSFGLVEEFGLKRPDGKKEYSTDWMKPEA